MLSKINPKTEPSCPADVNQFVYQIQLQGHLSDEWAEWFDGLAITLEENGDTLLTGPVVDQAALHGLLRKVRDLGLPLLSVVCVEGSQGSKSCASARTSIRCEIGAP